LLAREIARFDLLAREIARFDLLAREIARFDGRVFARRRTHCCCWCRFSLRVARVRTMSASC
jgi:hypothetical protein